MGTERFSVFERLVFKLTLILIEERYYAKVSWF